MEMSNPYNQYLDKNPANYVPLSPLSFLERTAVTHPHLTSIIYNEQRFTWEQTYLRCKQFASALHQLGVGEGDTVSTMLPNIPAMYEAHFAIPMTGAVLNTLNTRLNAQSLAFMLDHCDCKVLLVDTEFADLIEQTVALLQVATPVIIDVDRNPTARPLGWQHPWGNHVPRQSGHERLFKKPQRYRHGL